MLNRLQRLEKECTCNRCGWVHVAVSEAYAVEEAEKFLEFYDSLTPAKQTEYYGERRPDPLAQYSRCFGCGQTDRDFRPAKDDDCPVGCTLQATIWEG
jgi:hypothetical protein